MINNKTYQPIQALTIKASENLPAFRFVSHLGSLCSDECRAIGVTETDWLKGEFASVLTLGTIAVETMTSVAIGDDITSTYFGKAKKADSSDPVNGRALESCYGAGLVKIKIVP